MEQIFTALDSKQLAGGVFLDVTKKKAFDTINHFAICNKLAAYGTSPKIVTWFQSELCQLRVVIGNSDSPFQAAFLCSMGPSCLRRMLMTGWLIFCTKARASEDAYVWGCCSTWAVTCVVSKSHVMVSL